MGYRGVAKEMSEDHKPTNVPENARITAAGGFVEFGRVNGKSWGSNPPAFRSYRSFEIDYDR